MVANLEGTVGNVEETVAFIEATNFLKKEKGVKFGEIGKLLGLNRGQLNMTRIKRRYITLQEVDKLLQHYPETAKFFKNTTSVESDEIQTLNEPMSTHFYGKTQDPWQQLAETQKELLEKQKEELAALKEQVRHLEMEKKVLSSTIDGILSTKK